MCILKIFQVVLFHNFNLFYCNTRKTWTALPYITMSWVELQCPTLRTWWQPLINKLFVLYTNKSERNVADWTNNSDGNFYLCLSYMCIPKVSWTTSFKARYVRHGIHHKGLPPLHEHDIYILYHSFSQVPYKFLMKEDF